MGAAAAPIMVGTSLLSAGGSYLAGQSANKAGKIEAAQHEYEAKVRDLRAKQISADARADLNAKLGAIEAVRASKGLNDMSPTAIALRRAVRNEAYEAEARDVLSERFGIMASNAAAYAARRRGQAAMLQGYMGAAQGIGQAVSYLPKKA